jgi:transposase InsO family protein
MLGQVFTRFHVWPGVIHVDHGTQMTSLEVSRNTAANLARLVFSPIRSCWTNGRAVRMHRILNETLRSHLEKGQDVVPDYKAFESVKKSIMTNNCTPQNRKGVLPHDMIFTFRSRIWPLISKYRPIPDYHVEIQPDTLIPHPQVKQQLPEPGKLCLFRVKTN